jgi:CHAT domain-containing protein
MLRRTALILLLLLAPLAAQPTKPGLEQAERLLREDRAEQALPLLQDGSFAARVLRAEALWMLDRFNEGALLVDSLAAESAHAIAAPYDFDYLMVRAAYEQTAERLEQAERSLSQAARLAHDAEQRVEAFDKLFRLQDSRQEWDKAEATVERCESLLDGLGEYRLAMHLVALGHHQQNLRRRPEAQASFTAARALFERQGLPLRAASAQRAMAANLAQNGDLSNGWRLAEAAMTRFEKLQSPPHVVWAMGTLFSIAAELGEKRDATRVRMEQAAASLPPGPWAVQGRTMEARFALLVQGDEEGAEAILERLEQAYPPARERLQALALMAAVSRSAGRREEALARIDEALSVAVSRFSSDPLADTSPGSLLLERALIQRDGKQFSRALDTIHRALAAQPGPDWAAWRERVRYEAVMTALAAYDLPAARQELTAGLDTLEELPSLPARAQGFTRLLAALGLNQSLEQDLLDPAERIFGPYDPLAQALLTDMLTPPGAFAKDLGLYDAWIAQLRGRGNDPVAEATALLYKSIFLEASGRPAEARLAVLEALPKSRQKQMRFVAQIGYLLLARLEDFSARPQEALRALEQAVALAQGAATGNARFYNLVLASYQRQHGREKESLRTYQRAIDLMPDKAWAGLYGKALSEQALGADQAALADLALALASPEVASRPVSRATLLTAQARLLLHQGRTAQACQAFAAAFPSLLENGEPATLAAAALEYAASLERLGQPEQALEAARSALDAVTARGSVEEKALQPLYEKVATLCLRTGHEGEALHYLELSRSAELVGSVKLSQVEHDDPATRALLADLDRLKSRLETLQVEAGRTDPGEKSAGLGKMLAATREEFFAKLDELKRSEPDFESLVQLSGSSLSAIQASLDGETALLEFYPSQETLYLFVVTRDQLHLHQVLVGRDKLAETVQRYASLARDPESDERALGQLSRLLHGLLLEPALGDLGAVRRLRLVASGPLWLLPFEELRDHNGSSLDERFEVSMLTSADVLRSLSVKGARGGKTLLVGGADEDLPGARAELEQLAAMLPGATVLSGAAATSTALRASARQAGIVHIASHSGAGERRGECYISLADGAFPLEKIYGLSLARGALVVLSSCRSALGDKRPGREMTSLASAFAIAGASSVIASHWEVDDEVTRELFLAFYGYLGQGHERAEALRLARRQVAKRHPHPYYWAAFSLFGSPR